MDRWGRQLINRAVESLARYHMVWLVLVVLIPVLAYRTAARLSFDQNIQSMFSPDDDRLEKFLYSKERFGGDEFAIVAWKQPGLFDEIDETEEEPAPPTLNAEISQQISAFADQLSAIPGVNAASTQSLPDALRIKLSRDAVLRLLENVLVSEDKQTTAIVLRLKPESDTPVPRVQTIAAIRKAAKAHDPSGYLVGEPIQVNDMFRIVQKDGSMLFFVSLVILSAVIYVLFRNIRWVILPVIAVVSTIVCTEALLVVSQLRLSMVSSMLNSMVTIIVIATSTHVTVHYRAMRASMDPEDAMKQTLRDLAAPVFWTCATTGVGFMALLSSEITPVSSFGLMMGLASMVAFGVLAFLIPGGVLVGSPRSLPRRAPAEDLLSRVLSRVSSAIAAKPLLLMLLGFLLMALTLPGLFKLRLETDFSKNFRKSSDIVQSLEFVETELGGAGIWEVNFPAPPIEELSDEFLGRVRDFGSRLREMKDENGDPALNVASLTDGLDLVPRIVRFLKPKLSATEARLSFLDGFQPEFVPSMYNSDARRMRIVLRSHEQQRSEEKLAIIERVQEMAEVEFATVGGSEEPPNATGMFVLLTFVIQSLLGDQIVSFAWAAVGISLMMMLAFRSFALGLLSLIPNVFPIVLVIGTMGWIGTPVNIGTAMIASVSMGLTVDSTIHYISAFQRALKTQSVDAAIRATHQSVGRALVFAHVALIAGFLVLTLSEFIPLVYFGVLLSLSMLGGLVGDLVMLPVLLRWIYGRRAQQVTE